MIRTSAVFLALAAPASAAQCYDRATVLEQLADRWQEQRIGAGLTSSGAVVEVYMSATGTWTLTATTAAGMTCVLADGNSFETYPLPRPGEPG